MASNKIKWKKSAIKEFRKLDKPAIPIIINAVENLSLNPNPIGSRKLRGTDFTYRIRIGQYRIVYSIHAEVLVVEIIRDVHRKHIY